MEHVRLKVFRVVARHFEFRSRRGRIVLTQPAVTHQINSGGEDQGVTPLRHAVADEIRMRTQ
jgi:DNA-binding transcriptional LysR family regulator